MSVPRRIVLLLAAVGLIPLYATCPRFAVDKGTRYNVTGTSLEFMGRVDPGTAAARLTYYLVGAGLLFIAVTPRRRPVQGAA